MNASPTAKRENEYNNKIKHGVKGLSTRQEVSMKEISRFHAWS